MRDWNEYDRHHVNRDITHNDGRYGNRPLHDDKERSFNEHDYRDRSWWNRAGDEVLSWFGDDYAERRRRHDIMHYGKGPKNYRRSDDRIREDINDRLTDEYSVDASDIEVSVIDGDVILSGFVSDRFQKRRAEDVTEQIRGVKHVENRIKVDPYTPKDNVNLIP